MRSHGGLLVFNFALWALFATRFADGDFTATSFANLECTTFSSLNLSPGTSTRLQGCPGNASAFDITIDGTCEKGAEISLENVHFPSATLRYSSSTLGLYGCWVRLRNVSLAGIFLSDLGNGTLIADQLTIVNNGGGTGIGLNIGRMARGNVFLENSTIALQKTNGRTAAISFGTIADSSIRLNGLVIQSTAQYDLITGVYCDRMERNSSLVILNTNLSVVTTAARIGFDHVRGVMIQTMQNGSRVHVCSSRIDVTPVNFVQSSAVRVETILESGSITFCDDVVYWQPHPLGYVSDFSSSSAMRKQQEEEGVMAPASAIHGYFTATDIAVLRLDDVSGENVTLASLPLGADSSSLIIESSVSQRRQERRFSVSQFSIRRLQVGALANSTVRLLNLTLSEMVFSGPITDSRVFIEGNRLTIQGDSSATAIAMMGGQVTNALIDVRNSLIVASSNMNVCAGMIIASAVDSNISVVASTFILATGSARHEWDRLYGIYIRGLMLRSALTVCSTNLTVSPPQYAVSDVARIEIAQGSTIVSFCDDNVAFWRPSSRASLGRLDVLLGSINPGSRRPLITSSLLEDVDVNMILFPDIDHGTLSVANLSNASTLMPAAMANRSRTFLASSSMNAIVVKWSQSGDDDDVAAASQTLFEWRMFFPTRTSPVGRFEFGTLTYTKAAILDITAVTLRFPSVSHGTILRIERPRLSGQTVGTTTWACHLGVVANATVVITNGTLIAGAVYNQVAGIVALSLQNSSLSVSSTTILLTSGAARAEFDRLLGVYIVDAMTQSVIVMCSSNVSLTPVAFPRSDVVRAEVSEDSSIAFCDVIFWRPSYLASIGTIVVPPRRAVVNLPSTTNVSKTTLSPLYLRLGLHRTRVEVLAIVDVTNESLTIGWGAETGGDDDDAPSYVSTFSVGPLWRIHVRDASTLVLGRIDVGSVSNSSLVFRNFSAASIVIASLDRGSALSIDFVTLTGETSQWLTWAVRIVGSVLNSSVVIANCSFRVYSVYSNVLGLTVMNVEGSNVSVIGTSMVLSSGAGRDFYDRLWAVWVQGTARKGSSISICRTNVSVSPAQFAPSDVVRAEFLEESALSFGNVAFWRPYLASVGKMEVSKGNDVRSIRRSTLDRTFVQVLSVPDLARDETIDIVNSSARLGERDSVANIGVTQRSWMLHLFGASSLVGRIEFGQLSFNRVAIINARVTEVYFGPVLNSTVWIRDSTIALTALGGRTATVQFSAAVANSTIVISRSSLRVVATYDLMTAVFFANLVDSYFGLLNSTVEMTTFGRRMEFDYLWAVYVFAAAGATVVPNSNSIVISGVSVSADPVRFVNSAVVGVPSAASITPGISGSLVVTLVDVISTNVSHVVSSIVDPRGPQIAYASSFSSSGQDPGSIIASWRWTNFGGASTAPSLPSWGTCDDVGSIDSSFADTPPTPIPVLSECKVGADSICDILLMDTARSTSSLPLATSSTQEGTTQTTTTLGTTTNVPTTSGGDTVTPPTSPMTPEPPALLTALHTSTSSASNSVAADVTPRFSFNHTVFLFTTTLPLVAISNSTAAQRNANDALVLAATAGAPGAVRVGMQASAAVLSALSAILVGDAISSPRATTVGKLAESWRCETDQPMSPTSLELPTVTECRACANTDQGAVVAGGLLWGVGILGLVVAGLMASRKMVVVFFSSSISSSSQHAARRFASLAEGLFAAFVGYYVPNMAQLGLMAAAMPTNIHSERAIGAVAASAGCLVVGCIVWAVFTGIRSHQEAKNVPLPPSPPPDRHVPSAIERELNITLKWRFVESLLPFFEDVRDVAHPLVRVGGCVDLVAATCLGILAGLQPDRGSGCRALAVVMALVPIIVVGYIAMLRPYRRRSVTIFGAAAWMVDSVVGAVSVALAFSVLDAQSPGLVTSALMDAVSLCEMIKFGLLLAASSYHIVDRLRHRLCQRDDAAIAAEESTRHLVVPMHLTAPLQQKSDSIVDAGGGLLHHPNASNNGCHVDPLCVTEALTNHDGRYSSSRSSAHHHPGTNPLLARVNGSFE